MTNLVEENIENGRTFTLDDIVTDLNSGNNDPLYYASDEQIYGLIEAGRIDEDFGSRYEEYQEEMRCLQANF